MALTFTDCNGYKTYPADDVENLEVDTDIVSGTTTGYFAIIEDNKIEVSCKTYEALKKHMKF